MIRSGICNTAKVEFLRGVHRETHIFKCALFPAGASIDKNTPGFRPEIAAQEVQGVGYTPGGKALLGLSFGLDGDTAFMSFLNIVWPTATITARGCMIYNDSLPGRPAICVINFGYDVISNRGNFTLAVPAANAKTAIIKLF